MASFLSQITSTSVYQNVCDRVARINFLGDRGKSSTAGSGNPDQEETMSASMRMLRFLTPLESYVVSLQSLLIWEKPYSSALLFISFNCLFWLIVSWNRRFYSILAVVIFFISLYKLWINHIWPEIRVPPSADVDTEGWTPVHPQVLSAPEISHYMKETLLTVDSSFRWLVNLRRTRPGYFCLLVTSVLTMTATVGKMMPGVVIVYTILMTLALGPGIALYVIPSSWFEYVRQLLNTSSTIDDECNTKEEKGQDDGKDESQLFSLNDDPSMLSISSHDESSLQLLSPSQLDSSFTSDYGAETRDYSDEEIQQARSASKNSSPAHSEKSDSSNGIRFVSSHFSSNGDKDFDEDYEMISESEFAPEPPQRQPPFESDL